MVQQNTNQFAAVEILWHKRLMVHSQFKLFQTELNANQNPVSKRTYIGLTKSQIHEEKASF